MQVPHGETEAVADRYIAGTVESLIKITHGLFLYFLKDDFASKFRRMLTIEQYRNENIAKLFRQLSFDDSITFQAQLFSALMQAGCFVKTDPYILAMEFFSPIFLLFYKFDPSAQSLAEAKDLFLRHVRHFNETYDINEINHPTQRGE
jgi:hypothetical protein